MNHTKYYTYFFVIFYYISNHNSIDMMRYGVSNKQIISNVLEHVYSISQHEITFTLYRCVRHLQTCLQSIPVFPVYGVFPSIYKDILLVPSVCLCLLFYPVFNSLLQVWNVCLLFPPCSCKYCSSCCGCFKLMLCFIKIQSLWFVQILMNL